MNDILFEFSSIDFYVEVEDDHFEYDQYSFDLNIDEVREIFNKNAPYIFTGSNGRWNGNVSYDYTVFYDFDDFYKRMSKDIQYIDVIVYKNKNITIKGHHHDGTNIYELIATKNIKKDELREIALKALDSSIYSTNKNELARDLFDKPFSRLNKEELVDFIYECSN